MAPKRYIRIFTGLKKNNSPYKFHWAEHFTPKYMEKNLPETNSSHLKRWHPKRKLI